MPLIDLKLNDTNFIGKDVQALADMPRMTAAELKAWFDGTSEKIIAPRINEIIDLLVSLDGASNIGTDINPNATGNTVMEQLLSIAALVAEHKNRSDNPHLVTKAQVGLSNADNTADLNKPISTAMQIALNGKEPVFTKNTAFNKGFGTSAAELRMNGTASVGSLDSVARIDHIHPTDTSRAPLNHTHSESEILNLTADLNSKAPLGSPNLTGVPTAPTATKGTNSKQIATTEFVQQSLGAGGYGDMMKAIYDTTGKNADVFAYTDSAKTEAIETAANDARKKANTAQANAIAAIPSSLPANGGNADTVDNYHAGDFFRQFNNALQIVGGDFNNFLDTGYYQARNCLNNPFGTTNDTHFYLLVFSHNPSSVDANWVKQIAYDVRTDYTYIRTKIGGNWSSWKEVYNSDFKFNASGKYKGDSQASQFINIGFTPSIVLIMTDYGDTFSNGAYMGGLAVLNGPCMKLNGNKIIEIVTNGFICYHNTNERIYCNDEYLTYSYCAIR